MNNKFNLDIFRESSVCNLSSNSNYYVTGDCLGQVHIYSNEESFIAKTICDSAITSHSINHAGNEIALAYDKSVNIRSFPDIEEEKQSLILRTTLDIRHIEYDPTGKYL